MARPTPTTAFVCYDMEQNTANNDYLETYQTEVDGRDGRHAYTLYVGRPTYTLFLPLGESNSSDLNTTALASAMRSELSELAPEREGQFQYCEPGGCRISEFCGRDKLCHEIDCESLFHYGPESVAGVQDKEAAHADADADAEHLEINCQMRNDDTADDTANTTDFSPCANNVWPLAVKYECRGLNQYYNNENFCPEDSLSDGRFMSFARRCVAHPNPSKSFVCYDMKETNLDSYVADYMNLITDNPICTSDNVLFSDEELPMCPANIEDRTMLMDDCFTAVHRMTNIIRGPNFGTNLYWRNMQEDALLNDLNLEALSFALYSTLTGESPSNPDPQSRAYSYSPWSAGLLVSFVFVVVGGIFTGNMGEW